MGNQCDFAIQRRPRRSGPDSLPSPRSHRFESEIDGDPPLSQRKLHILPNQRLLVLRNHYRTLQPRRRPLHAPRSLRLKRAGIVQVEIQITEFGNLDKGVQGSLEDRIEEPNRRRPPPPGCRRVFPTTPDVG